MRNVTKSAIRKVVIGDITRAHRRGTMRYNTSRKITPGQEMAYRLCHQDFFGLRQRDAAEVMGLTQQRVGQLLTCVEHEAPQLFPILPVRIAKMYSMFSEGNTCAEIAEFLGVSPQSVQRAIRRLMKCGTLYFRRGSERRLSYQPWMDEYITERF